jgi:ribosomal protein S27AE
VNNVSVHPAAIAAADWWAEQIGAPSFRAISGKEARRDREPMEMASMMQTLIADRHPVTAAQGSAFAEALAAVVTEQLGRCPWVSLGVDYGPDMILAAAAESSGVSRTRFPWKTHMSVTPDYVTAALGYRAPDALIWQSPEWVRPQCATHRYTDAPEYAATDDMCTLLRFHDGDHAWQHDGRQCVNCGQTYAPHYDQAAGGRCFDYRPPKEDS